MRNILKLEEAAQFFLAVFVLFYFDADWWWYIILVLGPDISMIGYLGGNKLGMLSYNLFHHKAIAIIVFVLGLILPDSTVLLLGTSLFGHSSMDRTFGYGLKTIEGFSYTHLGRIGKERLNIGN